MNLRLPHLCAALVLAISVVQSPVLAQPASASKGASAPVASASASASASDAATTVGASASSVAPSQPAVVEPAVAASDAASSEPTPVVTSAPHAVPMAQISAGDTAWVSVSSVLVLMMSVPGLALFYAGMVRKKNILATMAQTLAVCGLVTVLWFAVGYSLAFMPGDDYLGTLSAVWLKSLVFDKGAGLVSVHHLAPTVPESVFVMFQLTFAIITPALIAGAFAERMRFSAMLWFMGLWSILVYVPVAHWVWEPTGWLARMGALDFAGGTVVHVNAGVAGLVCAWMLGHRMGFGQEPLMPANLGYTMIGASLLWVGWMGFNGGSAVAADGRAGLAILVTQLAAASAAMTWMAAEWMVRGTPTLLGLCSGVVAGLVAITPASGFVSPGSAVIIGGIAGVACYWGATGLKRILGVDDSLDVFGVHGIGGIVGAVLTGVFASPTIGGVEGNVQTQLVAVAVTLVYSALMTTLILIVIGRVVGLRVSKQDERDGLDLSQHGERVE
ncbi:MAG: ammonium transporter [Aquabacterium sp.]